MSGARLADLPAIGPDRVLALKAEASKLRAETGIKQSAALAQIAQREGFSSWERLLARAGGRDAVLDAKYANPTEAMTARNARRADRLQRYGGGR